MLYIKAGVANMAGASWFIHWPVWQVLPVCCLYGPHLVPPVL